MVLTGTFICPIIESARIHARIHDAQPRTATAIRTRGWRSALIPPLPAAGIRPSACPSLADIVFLHVLKMLANAQRLKILCLLVEAEMTVGQIDAHLPELSQSALSQHLARLRDQGLMRSQREAQTLWYARVEEPSQRIMLALHDIYCGVWQ